jgi:hypothetical protein
MNSTTSNLNLRFLPSTGSWIARARKSQTSMIGAAVLCAVALTLGTPAFAASRNTNAAGPNSGRQMAPTVSAEEAAAQHQTLKFAAVVSADESQDATMMAQGETSYYGTWTVYPYARKFLVSFVAYNRYCQEVTPGYWTLGSIAPKYGKLTEQYVKGRLSNGDCSQYIYTGTGIYYDWVYKTGTTHNDEFKATWHGGSVQNMVTFYLKNR